MVRKKELTSKHDAIISGVLSNLNSSVARHFILFITRNPTESNAVRTCNQSPYYPRMMSAQRDKQKCIPVGKQLGILFALIKHKLQKTKYISKTQPGAMLGPTPAQFFARSVWSDFLCMFLSPRCHSHSQCFWRSIINQF